MVLMRLFHFFFYFFISLYLLKFLAIDNGVFVCLDSLLTNVYVILRLELFKLIK